MCVFVSVSLFVAVSVSVFACVHCTVGAHLLGANNIGIDPKPKLYLNLKRKLEL